MFNKNELYSLFGKNFINSLNEATLTVYKLHGHDLYKQKMNAERERIQNVLANVNTNKPKYKRPHRKEKRDPLSTMLSSLSITKNKPKKRNNSTFKNIFESLKIK